MNLSIVTTLRRLIEQYATESNKGFKTKAIMKVIMNIEAHSSEITSGAYAKKHIKGVGKGLERRIDEIINTGTLSELTDIVALTELCSITGVGPKKANDLLSSGYESIDAIRSGVLCGDLTLNHHITVGLRYHEDLQERIPRNEMNRLGIIIGKAIKHVDGDLIYEICGSYRRGASTCGDIDILMSHPKIHNNISKHKFLEQLVYVLTDNNFLIDDLTKKGSKKYMGVCKISTKARRIDIRCVDWIAYYPALIYFTGSKAFNIMLRKKAQELGYSLSEYGFKNIETNEMITVHSEEALFAKLDINYVSPTSREI